LTALSFVIINLWRMASFYQNNTDHTGTYLDELGQVLTNIQAASYDTKDEDSTDSESSRHNASVCAQVVPGWIIWIIFGT